MISDRAVEQTRVPDKPMPAMAVVSEMQRSGPLGRPYLRGSLIALIYGLYLLPFMRLLLRGTDEGLFVYAAVRVARGEVFARDFFEIVGPGTIYWLASFFKLFGVSFATARTCLFLTSFGTGLSMYWLAHRICRRYAVLPGLVLAATAFGPIWPGISHHVDSNLLALLSVVATILWLDRRRSWMLCAAGALAGATTVVLLPKGVLLLAAILLWLVVQRGRLQVKPGEIAWLSCGYCTVAGIVLTYFWDHHALQDLTRADLLFPWKHYGRVNRVPYAQGIIRDYWKRWAIPTKTVRWTAVPASVLIVPFLYVAALPGILAFFGVWRRRSLLRPEIALFWMCGWALWLAEYHRKDICHLVFGSPLLMILGIHYLLQCRHRLAVPALQTLMLSSLCLAILNFFLALSAHRTVTRVGSIETFGDDLALKILDGKAARGAEIFVYPSDPIYYFLSSTVNPIRWGGLMYHYNRPMDFRDVVRVLDSHRVQYVLWNLNQEKDLREVFPLAERPTSAELIVEPYLESHYKIIWESSGTRVLERKGTADVR